MHGLVLPPDGKCLICARGREHAVAQAGPRTSTGTYLGLIVGILIVGTLVLGGIHFMTKKDTTAVTSIDDLVPPSAAGQEEAVPDEEEFVEPPPPPRRPVRSAFDTEAGTRRPGGDARSGDELKEAMLDVNITMYSTSWCDVCKAARRWMTEEGYRFKDLDVEASKTDSIVHKSLNPRGTVPTFDVEGTVLVGFDERRMAEAIKAKAESKLQ